ncbi:MAG: DNA polymerase Y family protein [Pedobacter sp.]|nr:MAG: DNA polymerase Y family protein [Pedobacter sp.]
MTNQRFVSLWFRYLLTDWLTLKRPELKNRSFVIASPVRNRVVVVAANSLAETTGIYTGMALADANAIIPGLEVVSHIPGQEAKLLQALGEWCIRYSPQVAVDFPEGLILDISGCAHLWGGEREYLKEIVTRLISKGYHVRGAMADTVGTAWAVARYGKLKPIIAPGAQEEALYPLPPAALRLDPVTTERLLKLGFHTIKSFIHTGRTALRRRFGQDFILKLDQALGNEEEPLQLLQPIEPYAERLPCLEPIRTREGIAIAIKELLERLCKRLYADKKGILTAVLKCYRIDGEILQVQIGSNHPANQVMRLFKLFELKIETIKPKLGIELFTLEAPKVGETDAGQEFLWSPEGCGLGDKSLAELLDTLANKIGADKIHRYLPEERHWPEQSIRLASSLEEQPATVWRKDRPRPSLLLPRPEKIEVSSILPDNPPMLFIYKGVRHIIKKADDAERIERSWWEDQGQHRDYYAVEDEEGRRYWVFRSGHYNDECAEWYLHGFFA